MKTDSLSGWIPIALAGFCATLAGLGIGRFSYVAILPLMIDAGWASKAGAAQLAAANLIGYLIGALVAHRLALMLGAPKVIRCAMATVLISLLCCSINLGFGWLWFWRMAAGAAGAALISMSGPHILNKVPVAVRGKAIGVVFSGIGFGIILSGFSVPALGAEHLNENWLVLAAMVAISALFSWSEFRGQAVVLEPEIVKAQLMPRGAMLALMCAYSLDAVGYLPHTVFWVEYLVHGLNKPMAVGGAFWAVFGSGALIGPLFSGFAADRFGYRRTLVACFALKTIGVGLPLISTSMPALFISSFVVGALTPALGALVSGRAAEIGGTTLHQRNWAMLTFFYAAVQAVGGYAMASIYAATHSFNVLFSLGTTLLALATVIAMLCTSAR